jgi:O-antigen/teichoic acid export membrane protein
MGITATKYVAQYRSADFAAAVRVIAVATNLTRMTAGAVTLMLLLGADLIASRVLGAPELTVSLAISSAAVFFTVLAAVPFGTLAGLEAFDRIAAASITYAVVYVVATLLLTYVYGVNGGVVGIAAAALVRWWVLRSSMRTQMVHLGVSRQIPAPDTRERRVILNFAIPAAATGLITLPALWAAQAILATQPAGFSELALFSAAFAVKNVVLFLPGLFNTVATPILNNAWGQNDVSGFRQAFHANITLNTGLLVAAGVGVTILSSQILGLYGTGFTQAGPALRVMMLAALLEGVGIALYQVIQSQERMWASFLFIALPRDVLVVLFALWLIPQRGALGLAIAYTCAVGLSCLAIGIMALRLEPGLFRRRIIDGPRT